MKFLTRLRSHFQLWAQDSEIETPFGTDMDGNIPLIERAGMLACANLKKQGIHSAGLSIALDVVLRGIEDVLQEQQILRIRDYVPSDPLSVQAIRDYLEDVIADRTGAVESCFQMAGHPYYLDMKSRVASTILDLLDPSQQTTPRMLSESFGKIVQDVRASDPGTVLPADLQRQRQRQP